MDQTKCWNARPTVCFSWSLVLRYNGVSLLIYWQLSLTHGWLIPCMGGSSIPGRHRLIATAQTHKMAVFVSMVSWLHFSIVGGTGHIILIIKKSCKTIVNRKSGCSESCNCLNCCNWDTCVHVSAQRWQNPWLRLGLLCGREQPGRKGKRNGSSAAISTQLSNCRLGHLFSPKKLWDT